MEPVLVVHGLTRDLGPATTALLVVRLAQELTQPRLMDAHRILCGAWGEELLGEDELDGDEALTSRFLVRFLDGPLTVGSVEEALEALAARVAVEEAWIMCQETGVDLVEDAARPGWRDGPPPAAEVGELGFALEGYPAILEQLRGRRSARRAEGPELDREDLGVTVTLTGEPLPGEQDVVAGFHTFWLGAYVDERVLDQLDDGSLEEEDLEELEEELEPTCFREGGVAWDGRTATLWVDRFNHPGTVAEVVHHLLWIVEQLSRVVPLSRVSFGGADMRQKYGAPGEGDEAPPTDRSEP
jgi:hypothetical protein